MGGKGRKRREKNYRAAHGGDTRLPPPPDPSYVDALPSKLRKIIAFKPAATPRSATLSAPRSSAKAPLNSQQKIQKKDQFSEKTADDKGQFDGIYNECFNEENGTSNDNLQAVEVKKGKKRRRNQVKDLRFGSEMEKLGVVSARQRRKKEFLKSKKKKQKKPNVEDNQGFHKHEDVKFGEVVEAPPKLSVPKGFKIQQGASQERIRLKAVEAYRNLRNWKSRPGANLPQMM